MSDLFTTLASIQFPLSRGAQGESSDRVPGVSPQVKDGIWAERAVSEADVPPVDLLPGLARWWSFSGNTTDAIGGLSGTLLQAGSNRPTGSPASSVTATTGKNGGGLRGNMTFTGLALSTQWSFALWINNPSQLALTDAPGVGSDPIGAFGARLGALVQYGVFGVSNGLYWEAFTNGTSRFNFFDGVTAHRSSLFTTSAAWKHAAVTYNAGALKLWVDGVLEASASGVVNPPAFNTIGSGFDSFALQNGVLDEIGIWNGRVLSPIDVASLYNGGAGRFYPSF